MCRPLALLLLVSVLAGCGDDAPKRVATQLLPLKVIAGDRSPDGGGLRLVESGFTNMHDTYGIPMLSWGLVFENTSPGMVVYNAGVRLRLLDAAGQPMADQYGNGGDSASMCCLVLMGPGQRRGVGNTTYVARDGGVASITVEILDVRWGRADPDVRSTAWAPLTAGGVITRRRDDRLADISFIVTSELSFEPGYPVPIAVFRDASGRIVGGVGLGRSSPMIAHFRPGKSEGQLTVQYGIPPTADDDRTEVYISPI